MGKASGVAGRVSRGTGHGPGRTRVAYGFGLRPGFTLVPFKHEGAAQATAPTYMARAIQHEGAARATAPPLYGAYHPTRGVLTASEPRCSIYGAGPIKPTPS
jgi:hypothetical protein